MNSAIRTRQDIILTLREKLSIRSIDHFALVLEEQYNVLKTHLLHEEELIEEVSGECVCPSAQCTHLLCRQAIRKSYNNNTFFRDGIMTIGGT